MKKYFWFFVCIIFIFQHIKVQAQDTVIHETLQINPNIEMLMGHEYYNGIHVKSIKVKQVEVEKDNYIKNGKIIEVNHLHKQHYSFLKFYNFLHSTMQHLLQ